MQTVDSTTLHAYNDILFMNRFDLFTIQMQGVYKSKGLHYQWLACLLSRLLFRESWHTPGQTQHGASPSSLLVVDFTRVAPLAHHMNHDNLKRLEVYLLIRVHPTCTTLSY